MWVKWPAVIRISTGDLTALSKSATQAYLLFSFLFLCIFVFSSVAMKYKLRSYSIQVFGLLTRVIKGGQLGAKLGTHRCGFWGLTERIVFLTWKKRHFWLEVAFCFLPHKWKYRSLHLYWLAITHLRVAWDSHAHANELLRKWPTFCDIRHHDLYGFLAKWRLKRNEHCLVPRHHYSPQLMRFGSRSFPICHRNALTEKAWEDAEPGLGIVVPRASWGPEHEEQ